MNRFYKILMVLGLVLVLSGTGLAYQYNSIFKGTGTLIGSFSLFDDYSNINLSISEKKINNLAEGIFYSNGLEYLIINTKSGKLFNVMDLSNFNAIKLEADCLKFELPNICHFWRFKLLGNGTIIIKANETVMFNLQTVDGIISFKGTGSVLAHPVFIRESTVVIFNPYYSGFWEDKKLWEW